MTRPRGKHIKAYGTDKERAAIADKAKAANLSLSAYLVAAGLNHPVRAAINIEAVNQLTKVHGELGKLAVEKSLPELRELQTAIHQVMGKLVR